MKNSYICQNTHKSHKGNTAQVLCGVAFTFLHGIPFQATGSESFKNIVFITRNVVKFIHNFLTFSNPYKFSEIRRITPAYAGKSIGLLIALTVSRDHPRLCGEKVLVMMRKLLGSGSPPPMRGKVDQVVLDAVIDGITPAYAGKRLLSRWTPLFRWDHPRLCGEKFLRLVQPFQLLGSPPPMRGKESPNFVNHMAMGITPAYAGKRFRRARTSAVDRDHPRLCGEKLVVVEVIDFQGRITPAYAGKRKSLHTLNLQ